MASNIAQQGLQGQTKRTSFSGFAGNNASILLDRAKAGIRGSTPDSEALASSDDEHDYLHRLHTVTSNPGPKPGRRASWFTDGQHSSTRKPSFGGGSGPFSPVSPGTAGSSGDQAPWSAGGHSTSSTLGRGHSSSSSFPWGNTIWNSESQKGPPQRLAEVLPSPTTMIPPGSANLSQDDKPIRSPPLGRDHVADPSIPFSIPLQPTLKSYRSQSYSVGQIDPESTAGQTTPLAVSNIYSGSKRVMSYGGVHHRPSRPSMLGDVSHDANALGELREVDDDEEALGPPSTGQAHLDDTRTFEDLAGENAMLRQQLVANQLEQNRGSRLSLTSQRPQTSGQYYHQRLQDSVLEEAPMCDFDDRWQYDGQRLSSSLGRRFSEFGTSSGPHYAVHVNADNRTLDHVKRGQWQSSLGFARVEEPPQSRRHSFAEMPTRHNSLGSAGDDDVPRPIGDFAISTGEQTEDVEAFSDSTSLLSQGDPLKYFCQPSVSPRDRGGVQSLSASSFHGAYTQTKFQRPTSLAQMQTRPNQLLYIVTFKCLRADVFYVQEGTGLRVKKGDLVIVEADRGTDLGTVQSDSVSWSEAKQLKEEYTKRHHEWLMAFSRHTQNGTVAGPNPNGSALPPSSAGLPNPVGFQDLPVGEIKPKMIKRLAQPHEIATLREKEGGEAKAKRMCQQKVVDHRLNMEILDAEFQMDWKKLTFFYFADAYINFNPLVTDLFKIYKTRIWMSAINTAAIASPHAGPRASGLSSRGGHPHEYEDYRPGHYSQGQTAASSHTPLNTAFTGLYDSGRMTGGIPFDPMYPQAFPAQSFEARPISHFPVEFRPQSQQAVGVTSQYVHDAEYTAPSLHHAASFGSQHENNHAARQNRQVPTGDWTQAFQGMTLGR